MQTWLSDIRRDFHRHPEPAFAETRTTERIKEKYTPCIRRILTSTKPAWSMGCGSFTRQFKCICCDGKIR